MKAIIARLLKRRSNRQLPSVPLLADDPRLRGYNIGAHSYGSLTVYQWDDRTNLTIGKFCSFAHGVTIILGGEHRTDWITTYPFNVLFEGAANRRGHPASKGDIAIGNDVWIGHEALILSGVTIGNGAVVGARSVVTRDVDAYSVVAGNPATHRRYRFDESVRESLNSMKWWDWPMEKIQASFPLLLSADVEGFVERFRGIACHDA